MPPYDDYGYSDEPDYIDFSPIQQQNRFSDFGYTDVPDYLNPTFPAAANQIGIYPQDVGVDPMTARMNQLYTPESAASQRFNQLIGNFPQRQKPSILRRIGAGLVSLGKMGPEGARRTINAPFYNQVADWQAQITPMQKAAELERQQNAEERIYANQVAGRELETRRAAETERKNVAGEEIRRTLADIQELKATRPDLKWDTRGEEVLVFDPQTGKTTRTGIPTGSLSETQKLLLEHQYRMSEIGARTAGQIEVAKQRKVLGTTASGQQVVQTFNPDGTPGEIVIIDKGSATSRVVTPAAPTGETEPTPPMRTITAKETIQKEQLRISRIMGQHPEWNRSWVKVDPNTGMVNITKPNITGGLIGPTQQQHDAMQAAINNPATAAMPPPVGRGAPPPATAPPSQKQAPPAPAGWKYVPKPGGGWTAVPVK